MKPRHFLTLIALLIPVSAGAEEIAPKHLEFFEKNIRPVLVEKCYKCHAEDAEKIKGDLLLDTREGMLRGGETGPAVVPGDLKKSLLIEAIRYRDEDLEMPPKEQLSEKVISDFEKWIAMGAPDPRVGGEGAGISVKDVIDFEEGRQYWAFQPPAEPAFPKVKDSGWPRTKVDALILAGLEEKGLQPVDDADRPTLIRRLYFDLIGLPPAPEQVEAFVADTSPVAVAKVVDELLASRHFGERWGRHWLDVARYGESSGMERNFAFPSAWRYRDYVIACFNEDKPYNEFIREQIAGDLVLTESTADRDRLLIATGFLAIGPKSLNQRDKEQFKMDIVDEQIDVACRAVLGLTVSCARCHDHKFDPISTKDYYAMAGFFTNTQTFYGTPKGKGNRQPSTLMAIGEDGYDKSQALKKHREKLAEMGREMGRAKKEMNGLRKKIKDKQRLAAETKNAKKEIQQLEQRMRAFKQRGPDAPDYAMAVLDRENIEEAHLLIRGDVESKGDPVTRDFLTVMKSERDPQIAMAQSGRAQLAEWMSAETNPLPGRVMVNRIWHHLFGQGLVRTVDNFGSQGEAPTHPALLDHLALKFAAEGWSVKKAIRDIVLSRAYQLSSAHHERNFEIDPDNRLVWRMNTRRLDAEALRDAVLAASGELDREPVEASVVAELGNSNIGRDTKSREALARGVNSHRSVYLPIVRNIVPEFLSTFDFAEPSILVGRRNITTVPTQALYMMNSDFILEQSARLSKRVFESEAGDREARIDQIYLRALSRTPDPGEKEAAARFLEEFMAGLAEQKENPEEAAAAAWASLSQALLASAEFRYLN